MYQRGDVVLLPYATSALARDAYSMRSDTCPSRYREGHCVLCGGLCENKERRGGE